MCLPWPLLSQTALSAQGHPTLAGMCVTVATHKTTRTRLGAPGDEPLVEAPQNWQIQSLPPKASNRQLQGPQGPAVHHLLPGSCGSRIPALPSRRLAQRDKAMGCSRKSQGFGGWDAESQPTTCRLYDLGHVLGLSSLICEVELAVHYEYVSSSLQNTQKWNITKVK